MTDCKGRGECIRQCFCDCYDDNDNPLECECGHRHHKKLIGGPDDDDIYCQTDCSYKCRLIECHNFKLCGRKAPEWVNDTHNGMCFECAISVGKIKFNNEKAECPICMETKDMITLCCDIHKVCLECWGQIDGCPKSCPMCRKTIF